MKVRIGAFLLVASLAAAGTAAWAEDVKSGPQERIGGPFDIKAITGASAGKEFCYV
jgi:hypothetical protein